MMDRAMGVLTAGLMVVLGLFGVGWWLGAWQGNFTAVLMALALITGGYWVAEKVHFMPERSRLAKEMEKQDGEGKGDVAKSVRQPWWMDWTAGMFPVILVLFVLRAFVMEPFRIPSGSMVPTLMVGDFVMVNKFHYGVRIPVINKKVLDNNQVARGDVIVFRYPKNPSLDYIKRVVGVPGDEVAWRNQRLYVNGQEVATVDEGAFFDESSNSWGTKYSETLGGASHQMLVNRKKSPELRKDETMPFAGLCNYEAGGVSCTVPEGHYFMMGDNRDNSEDSRFWGFVPEENIVGKATMIWMSSTDIGRVGWLK